MKPARPDALRDALIRRTVESAFAHSPFYRRLYSQAGVDIGRISSTDDLCRLPTVDKAMLAAAGREALAYSADTTISHIQHTSGTTGEPFLLYRSTAERDFILEFFHCVLASEPRPDKRPILLQLHTPHHGTSTAIPSHCFVLDASVDIDSEIAHTFRLLQRCFDIPDADSRISMLTGGNEDIYLLTAIAHQLPNIEAVRDSLKLITVTGEHVTPRWRRLVADTWGVPLTDRFSMSEIFGGATHCSWCEGYHFDPHVVAELIDPRTGRRIDRGDGMLVLTSLFPFVQLNPMVRYRTGDYFSLDPDACALPRFAFLGRAGDMLFDDFEFSTVLLSGAAMIDVLDEWPEIAREISYPAVSHPAAQAVGAPRARGHIRRRNGRTSYELRVELRLPLNGFSEQSDFLARKTQESLFSLAPVLAERCARRQCEFAVTFVPARALGVQPIGELWARD